MGVQQFFQAFDSRPQHLHEAYLSEAFGASCVMAMVPEDMFTPFERFQDLIREEHIYDPANTEEQFGLEKEFHVTIVFGVESQSPNEVENLLSSVRPFSIILGRTSIFENEKYDVLKVEIEEEGALRHLNKEILDKLECKEQKWDYNPHLTIAYLKQGKGKEYSGYDQFDGIKLQIDTIQFSSSEGQRTDIELR